MLRLFLNLIRAISFSRTLKSCQAARSRQIKLELEYLETRLAPATAILLPDGDFTAPGLAAGTFQYAPTGSPWTFNSGSGVASNGSGFTSLNSNAPVGTQVAFLQSYGSMTQSVYFTSGAYSLTFLAAQRAGLNTHGAPNNEQVQLLVDGVQVGLVTPDSTQYEQYQSQPFSIATAGMHTVEFLGLLPAGSDNTAFFSEVSVGAVAANTVNDGNFTAPGLAAGTFQYAPTGSPWTFNSGSGVASNGSGFTSLNSNAPVGTQVAFLQSYGSMTQSVYFTPGNFEIGFLAAQRAGLNTHGAPNNEQVQLLVDGVQVGLVTPDSTQYEQYQSQPFSIATAGMHTVEFLGLLPAGSDNTAFFSEVSVGAVAANAQTATSPNWSGYVIQPASQVTAVGGSWIVPTVGGGTTVKGAPAAFSSSSIWVGIDGYGGSTVEQIGTEENFSNGQASYNAWVELFGDKNAQGKLGQYYSQTTIPLTVHAGDRISARVSLVANTTSTFRFDIQDIPINGTITEAWGGTLSTQYVVPLRTSGEWIAEATTYGTEPALANFGAVQFTGAWATAGAATGPIDSFPNVAVNMSDPAGGGTSTPTGVADFSIMGPYEFSGTQSSTFGVFYQFGAASQAEALTAASIAPDVVVAAEFVGSGVWIDTAAGWQQLTTADASLLVNNANGDVVAEFPGAGVWLYTASVGQWTQLTSGNASLLAMDGTGDVAAEFAGYGVFEYHLSGGTVTYQQVTTGNASLLAMDAYGDVAAEFSGVGVYYFNAGGGYEQLTSGNASLLALDGAGDVVAEFAGYGVFEYHLSGGTVTYQQVTTGNASLLAMDAAGDVVAEFAGNGVYYFNAGGGYEQLTSGNASLLAMDGAGDAIAEFAGYGIFEYSLSGGPVAYQQTTTADASLLATDAV